MRHDVKLGFVIGGVLLAVLIVYVLVVPSGAGQKKVSQGGASSPARADGGKVSLEPLASNGGATTRPIPAVPPPAFDARQVLASAGRTDPFAPKTEATSESQAKAQDWNKILNDQPVLMTETPVASGSAKSFTPPAVPSPAVSEPPLLAASGAERSTESFASTPSTRPSYSAVGARTHVVQRGETLSSISTAAYGRPNLYQAIIRANPGIDPQHLKVGMTITLPEMAAVRPSDSGERSSIRASSAIDSAKEYRVQPGDSLYKISMKLYGRGDQVERIYQLNKTTIGDDLHRLKVGQVLQLPVPPQAASR